ncbi:hypothetical protein VVD49_04170 [Uliginosibacterium sp. H3]|uniref:Glycine zipper domain-containing protein n=1 Tax=Uliginosibacterium silvisoli TaxID=3114758 RepID=A0ABU6JZ11_9RHOO|nr:hypothetical protein [Uliginosibacterium sp. H3]
MAHHDTSNAETAHHDARLGTAIGAASGLASGALAGGVAAGPAGAIAGATVGAVVGGIGTRLLAEDFDVTPVDSHWRDRFAREPYYEDGLAYDDYAPAYHLGAAARIRHPQASFEEAEAAMEAEYMGLRGESKLAWERASKAARASFHTTYF